MDLWGWRLPNSLHPRSLTASLPLKRDLFKRKLIFQAFCFFRRKFRGVYIQPTKTRGLKLRSIELHSLFGRRTYYYIFSPQNPPKKTTSENLTHRLTIDSSSHLIFAFNGGDGLSTWIPLVLHQTLMSHLAERHPKRWLEGRNGNGWKPRVGGFRTIERPPGRWPPFPPENWEVSFQLEKRSTFFFR